MKIINAAVSVFTAAALFFCIAYAAPAENFSEITPEDILIGNGDGDLRIDDSVTRAEFSKLICLNILKDESKSGTSLEFSDVSSDHWAKNYIDKMAKTGLISGYGDGRFGPEDNITLIQAERIGLRILGDSASGSDASAAQKAMDFGLSDLVKTVHSGMITRGDAVNIINNIKNAESLNDLSGDYSYSFAGGGRGLAKSSAAVYDSGLVTDGVNYLAEEAMPAPGGIVYPDYPPFNTEEYAETEEGIFKSAALSPLSTFSIDTDTASYSNVRRFIVNGQHIDRGAVRPEEIINYFDYEAEKPSDGEIFSVNTETGICPWNGEHLLTKITVQGEELSESDRRPQNLTFLVDVSGSMYSREKLPLVKLALKLLLNKLDERDRISLVTYASGTSVLLDGVTCDEKNEITKVFDSLSAGGSTAGEAGLLLAYAQAEKYKTDSGNNRIILCTDGDFNVGISSTSELKKTVEEKRHNGIYLSIMGFGMGNYKDDKLEAMADNGNGNYFYIDSLKEAKKVLSDEMTKTLYTIAKDVKIQVEFNPSAVSEYRLIGYENRMLQTEDFENDRKDAGELGAGSTVTVLYEIVPSNGTAEAASLRYQTITPEISDELMTINIRYKEPAGSESILRTYPVGGKISESVSDDFRFSAAAAEFGMLLRGSEYLNSADINDIISLADSARGEDRYGLRSEFINLMDIYRMLNS